MRGFTCILLLCEALTSYLRELGPAAFQVLRTHTWPVAAAGGSGPCRQATALSPMWQMLCVLHFYSQLSLADESTAFFQNETVAKARTPTLLILCLINTVVKGTYNLFCEQEQLTCLQKLSVLTEYMSPNKGWFLLSFIWKKLHWDGLKNSTRSMQPVETLGCSAKTALEIN